MGEIVDLLKDVPLPAVVRVRLADQEAAFTKLKLEHREQTAEIIKLKAQVKFLEAQFTAAPAPVAGPRIQPDVCPHCCQPRGREVATRPNRPPQSGRTTTFQCGNCGERYDKLTP